MITKQQAENLQLNEIHQCSEKGFCQKWRRNGKTKVWKTKPNNFRVPIKNGLYAFGYLTQENHFVFYFPDECPNKENHK